MVRLYSYNKKIYSIDMMFAYVNLFKPKTISIDVKTLKPLLEHKCWTMPGNFKKVFETKKTYSPLEVINNPKKYAYDMDRIKKCNMKFPIIIDSKDVIDGRHRLAKAYMMGMKKIKAYFFDDALMDEFLLSRTGYVKKLDTIDINDIVELFYKKFLKKV